MKKRLTIAFDVTQLTTSSIGGVGYFSINLLKSLAEQNPHYNFVGFYGSRLFDKQATLRHLPVADNITYVKIFPPIQILYFLRRIKLSPPIEVTIRRIVDVVIYPNFLGFSSFRKETKLVNVIHDLTYVHYPDSMSQKFLSDLNKLLPSQAKNATLIITPSKQVANEVSKHFNVDPNKIVDCPIPASSQKSHINSKKLKMPTKRYCIFIGTIEPRKNIQNLLLAFESQSILKQNYELHIIGKKGWDKDLNKFFASFLHNNHFVKYHSYVSEREKNILLGGAEFLVLPSLYEGYGMPINEAYAAGKAVVVSDIPVFREICDVNAIYFNPNDIDSLSASLIRAFSSKHELDELANKARKRNSALSWSINAENIMRRLIEN